MEQLIKFSISRINATDVSFKRYLMHEINWKDRLIAITGARGVGKTTLLLQYINEKHTGKLDQVLYANLDDLYFTKNTIVDLTEDFVNHGGKYLFLDEVHKYPNWSQETKNIYDYFPELKIVITGSSALDIYRGEADLSRRAVSYKMTGMSFREFIGLRYDIDFPVLKLEDILKNAINYTSDISKKIKPIKLFEEYLRFGYFPYYFEDELNYYLRIKQTVNQILESDLISVVKIDYNAVNNLRKLLSVITEIAPFKPNILKLSKQIEISRETLVKYLYLLSKADLLMLLQKDTFGISKMNKPEKVFLNNPNYIYALSERNIDVGTLRETFFYNQLKEKHKVFYSDKSDFLVDNKYTFEIGGKNKKQKQISGIEKGYIAADNIEHGTGNRIPLWLFGFLY